MGSWDGCYVLDKHILSSECIGEDEFGHLKFDTTRTQMGELVFQIKYRDNYSVLGTIIDTIVDFIINVWKISIDLILPVPPSKQNRAIQPVEAIADGVGKKLGVEVSNSILMKVKDTSQLPLKNITDQSKREELLRDAFKVINGAVANKNVLVLDDLFDSGTTLRIITDVLKKNGKPNKVYVLACTITQR